MIAPKADIALMNVRWT